MNNPFEELAERQIPNPRKSVLRAVETRAARKREKELKEQAILFGEWNKWHKQRRDELLAGPYAKDTQELVTFLERMQLTDADNLIAHVESGPWQGADKDTKFLTLEIISWTIVRLREQAKLPPYDDAMPFVGEEPTAFEIIREMLR